MRVPSRRAGKIDGIIRRQVAKVASRGGNAENFVNARDLKGISFPALCSALFNHVTIHDEDLRSPE